MRFLKHHQPHGFTLIEMLLYMGLLAIFVSVLTDIFLSLLQVRLESQAYSSVQQDGRFILARLAYDIPQASAITTPATLGGTSATLSATINSVTYTYSVNNGRLQLTNNNGTDYLEGGDTQISQLSFQRLGNSGGKDTVLVSFTLNSTTQRDTGSNETQSFQSVISRRN